MLASEGLYRDEPSFQERRDAVYEPLLDLAHTQNIPVLGFGATSNPGWLPNFQGWENAPIPALLVEWQYPAMGIALSDYGGVGIVDRPSGLPGLSSERVSRLTYEWVQTSGLGRGFRSERLQFAGGFSVIALPRPLALAASPGDPAHCSGPNGPGTLGARVSVGVADCMLTAGHVAPIGGGTRVYNQNARRIGKISKRMCCSFDENGCAVVPNTDVPDVAIIELSVPDPTPSTTSQGVARIRDMVSAHGAVTAGKRSELSTVATAFAGPGAGNWGEAMLTAYPISAPGDSGAQVVNNAGEVVGQVVGGYPGVYSVVQDIDYLLNATGAVLR